MSVLRPSDLWNPFEFSGTLEGPPVFGSYPELFSIENDPNKGRYLRKGCSSYLYKDVLMLSGIRHRDRIVDLLHLLPTRSIRRFRFTSWRVNRE